jgi:hypothetical protein
MAFLLASCIALEAAAVAEPVVLLDLFAGAATFW